MAAIARRIAISVLNAINGSDATPDYLLNQAFHREGRPEKRDRALANELVLGVLRWRGRLDWIIQHLSKTPIHRIDPCVLNIVRLGLYQILFLSRIPASAAVNESVELAKGKAPAWVVRFVNAVLRSAARGAKDIPLPDDADDPVGAISIRESHPSWMVKRWVERLGAEEATRLCKANNQIPPVTVRANSLKIPRQELLGSLRGHAKHIGLTRFSCDGLTLRGLQRAIGEMPEFVQGWFQVQDEAAQLITYLLDPRPGENVLDACAGLGGKTGHIAQLMQDSGKITAADYQPWKLRDLKTSMARLGISSVRTWQQDLLESAADSRSDTFDRILLDAPCSGLGVLRRNPDIKWKKSQADLSRLKSEQERLLGSLAPLVKMGGLLVYCVCSLEPEEGEEVVQGFLKSHGDFVIDRTAGRLSEAAQVLVNSSGFLKTLPHEHDMDGFFAVRLKKVAA